LGASQGQEHAPGPNFDEVWARLKVVLDLKSQIQLASMLGIKSPSVTDAKKRGLFPLNWAYLLATKYNISLDLILLGRSSSGESSLTPNNSNKPIYIDSAVELVEEAVRASGRKINSEQKAALVSIIRDELKRKTDNLLNALTG
jgi:hypothetical protein